MAGALVRTNIVSTLASMGLDALRETIVLAKTTNRSYEQDLSNGVRRNQTVDIAIPAAVAVRTVTPDVVPPAVTAITPTNVSLTMDQHEEAPFILDDQALIKVDRGIVPMQLTEAVKAVANGIDNHIWGKVTAAAGVYGFAGTAGTTPFGTDLTEFTDARKVFLDQLGPLDEDNVFFVFDTAVDANTLNLDQVTNAASRGDGGRTKLRGEIGSVLGARWIMSQNVPTHSQTAAGTILVNDAGTTIGDGTLTWDGGGTQPAVGDIFTVDGDTQTYQVQSATATVITMLPASKVAWANSAVVTFKGSYVANLLYHRNFLAFAMAPLLESNLLRNEDAAIAFDEELGMGLRVELTKQHHQYQWTVDAMYGAVIVRPEYAVIVAG